MVAHFQLAAVLTEAVGALILAKSLAFEDVELYVRGEGTPKWGFDTYKDVARARAAAEAFGGLALVAVGLVGQAIATLGVSEPRRAWVAFPYAIGLGTILLVWRGLIPQLFRRRLRKIIRTRIALGKNDIAKAHQMAHALNGYSRALDIDGFSRPASCAVREHVEGVLGGGLLGGLTEVAEQLSARDWCAVRRPDNQSRDPRDEKWPPRPRD